ncbi:hypothetical protein H4R33_000916 [Dimargaris cristalligena]|nr:hypothetical protein H4R33_000916 [Dimargaris cristalligena]
MNLVESFYRLILIIAQVLFLVIRSITKFSIRFRDRAENYLFRRQTTHSISTVHALGRLTNFRPVSSELRKLANGGINPALFQTLRQEYEKLPKVPEHFSFTLPAQYLSARVHLNEGLPRALQWRYYLKDVAKGLFGRHYLGTSAYQRPDHIGTQRGVEATVTTIANVAFWSLAAGIPCLSVFQPQWHVFRGPTESYHWSLIQQTDDEKLERNQNSDITPLSLDLLLQVLEIVQVMAREVAPTPTARSAASFLKKQSREYLENEILPTIQLLKREKNPSPTSSPTPSFALKRIVVVFRGERYPVGPEYKIPETSASSETTSPSTTSDLEIHLFDAKLGLPKLADLTQTLATQVQSGELALDDINVKFVDAKMQLTKFIDPNLVLVTGGPFAMNLYPAWATRYAEVQHAPEYQSIKYPAFRRALYRFAKCSQRFGT